MAQKPGLCGQSRAELLAQCSEVPLPEEAAQKQDDPPRFVARPGFQAGTRSCPRSPEATFPGAGLAQPLHPSDLVTVPREWLNVGLRVCCSFLWASPVSPWGELGQGPSGQEKPGRLLFFETPGILIYFFCKAPKWRHPKSYGTFKILNWTPLCFWPAHTMYVWGL